MATLLSVKKRVVVTVKSEKCGCQGPASDKPKQNKTKTNQPSTNDEGPPQGHVMAINNRC